MDLRNRTYEIYLYEDIPKDFAENGMTLIDFEQLPEITRSINSTYSFYGVYKLNGQFREEIKRDMYIKAIWEDSSWQFFKIYSVRKNLSNVSFTAKHIGFEAMRNFIQSSFTANGNGSQIMLNLSKSLSFKQPFVYKSDITSKHQFTAKEVNPIDAMIGQNNGNQNLAGVISGELDMDNYNLTMKQRIGTDSGFRIDFGINLESIEEFSDDSSIVNSLYLVGGEPEGKQYDSNQPPVIYKYLEVSGVNDQNKRIGRRENSECKTTAELIKWGKSLFDKERIHEPKVTHSVNMISLENTTEYSDIYDQVSKLHFGDTAQVRLKELDIEIEERLIEGVFYPTLFKWKSVVLGNELKKYSNNVQTQLVEAKKELIKTADELSSKLVQASEMITGNSGGHVIQHPKNEPSDIGIMDTDDIKTAKHVLRMNKSGIGFSKKGWEGPFLTAWTIDGVFNADFIKAGILDGIEVHSRNKNYDIELNNGKLAFRGGDKQKELGSIQATAYSTEGKPIPGMYFTTKDPYITKFMIDNLDGSTDEAISILPKNFGGVAQPNGSGVYIDVHAATRKGLEVQEGLMVFGDLKIQGKLIVNGKEITGNGSGGGGGNTGGWNGQYPPEVTTSAEKFAWQAWTTLLSLGYSRAAAAGILGNVNGEAGPSMNPDTEQVGGPAYGAVQFDGSSYPLIGAPTPNGREYFQRLHKASGAGGDYREMSPQMKVVDWGMTNGQWLGAVEPTSVSGFKSMTSPEQAAYVFEENYERPRNAHPERQGYARTWYDKFVNLEVTKPLGEAGLQRLESLVMQRHGNGQCYAVPAEYSGVLGGCGLGAGTAYPLSHIIGDTEAAAEIGSGYDWGAVGWKVIFNPSYDQLVTGAIINWKRGGNIGGFNVDYEFGHTGVIRGLVNGGFQTYEQNIGLGQVIGKYERSWVGSSEISSIVIPPK